MRTGRRLKLVLSLVLLISFLITSGMGIFWVARQELPVFDLHYLLGYVTLALAMLHVALHWSSLAGLMRRSTWKAKEGQSGVGTVRRRRLVWLLTLGLAGLAGYGLGFNAGTEEVEVKMGVVMRAISARVRKGVANARGIAATIKHMMII